MAKFHDWITIGDQLHQVQEPKQKIRRNSIDIQGFFNQEESINSTLITDLPEEEQQLMQNLQELFFPVIQINEYKPTNGKKDTDVNKYTNQMIGMIITELQTLQQLLSTVDKDTTDVGNFQRQVIGRLMKRLLGMIPAYVDNDPAIGQSSNLKIQITNLMMLIEKRKVEKKTHELSLAYNQDEK